MSQKKLKRLRKQQKLAEVRIHKEEVTLGVRETIRQNWKFLVLLLLGVFFLYLNSLNGGFVSDDYATIPNNPLIKSFSNGLSGWMGGVINWFLAVTLGVESPIHFHVFSLLIFLLILVILFVFVNLILRNNLLAKVTVIIFAVLPIHVEGISWIAGRPYLLNTFFVIFSLVFFILYSRTEKKKYLYNFILLSFLTFTAERTRALALPLLVILYWISFGHKLKEKINLGKILLIFGGLFLVAVVLLWPQLITRVQMVNSGTNVSESIFYNPFFQYPTAIPKYLQLLWAPVDLTLYHTMYNIPIWMNWSILITYLFSVVYFFFKNKKIFFALAFIFVAAAPSMAPVKISWLVAERYMFLGSVGFAILIALILNEIWKKNKILPIVLLTSLVVVYGFRVIMRNRDWQTNHKLWVNTCQVSPNSHNAWNNIGDDYDKLGQYDNAIKGFRQSTLIKENYADAYHNMANILLKINRFDLAKETYKTGLSYNPNLYQSYFNLIQIDLNEKNYQSAVENLKILKQVQPNNLQVWYMEAVINIEIGKKEEAKNILKAILAQYPDYTNARNLLIKLSK